MPHDEVEGLHELRRKRHKKKRKREESLETTWNHDFGNVSLNYSKEDSEIDGDIDVMTGVERAEGQACSSNDEESIRHKDKKAIVDSCMISNNAADREKKKKKNRKSFLDISEETSLKKIKHEFESKMIEQRDKEKGQRMDQREHVAFDQGTENVHQRISVECVEDQASSNGEDCVKHKHKKTRVDLSMVSNIGENRKKKKREKNQKSLLDISEETSLKKIKHEFESKMIEQRDKEEGQRMDQHEHVAFDQGTESVHQRISVECVEDQASSNGEDCVKHKHKKARVKSSMVSNDVANRNKKMKEEPIRHANVIHETWTLSKERLKELKEKGIKVKSGKWSMQELHLLQSNMDKFLENYGLQDPDDILSLSSAENEERKYWKRFASENDFYKQLGEGIQRSLDTIVKCAKRIYDHANYKGKYTEEEVDELIRLQAIHGADWVTTGQLMGRSRMSVCRKFSTLLATTGVAKKGIWTEDELKCLKEAVHLVTNTSSDQEVPFEGISWQAVARMVKTRNKEQCRRKWLDRLCWTQNDNEKWWTKEDDFTLIARLYNSGVTEECDVDWMEVKTEFKNNYSPQWLRKKWSGIKKRVPDFQQKTFEVIVDYLFHHYAVIFEAWASNDDNK